MNNKYLDHAREHNDYALDHKYELGGMGWVSENECLVTKNVSADSDGDVVVGVVETHGRKETEALLQGLEIIPRRPTIRSVTPTTVRPCSVR